MVEPIVQFKDVHKSYGDFEVLKGIDINIGPTKEKSINGPTEYGKTTNITMLMKLEEPTVGDIIVEDTNIWKMERASKMVPANDKNLSTIRGEIGMVIQHFNLFPHMTIIDN